MRNKRTSSTILAFVLLFTAIFSIFAWNADASFAADTVEPDLVLYIHGEKSNGGPIFHGAGSMGEGLWAPSKTEAGTMRIYNNYSQRMKVTNLSLTMNLERLNGESYETVTDKDLYEKFAKSMELTIHKRILGIFTDSIYNKSFFEMLYDENNQEYNGYNLPILDVFNIGTNDYVDLEYVVHMAEEAGNELQGLRATINFMINTHENPVYYPPDDPEDPDDPEEEDDNDSAVDTNGHWAHDCIQTLIDHGVIQGYPDGTIRPENYISRVEVAALITRALNLELATVDKVGYKDRIPDWAKGYIYATSNEGIFTGYPGKLFKAYNNITRQEVAVVLIRAFKKELEEEIKLTFTDKQDIDDWALEYVKIGVQHHVIEGYPDKTFKPDNYITRAEVFTMLCKLLGYHKEHD